MFTEIAETNPPTQAQIYSTTRLETAPSWGLTRTWDFRKEMAVSTLTKFQHSRDHRAQGRFQKEQCRGGNSHCLT